MPMSPRLLRPRATGFDPRRLPSLSYWLDAADTSTITLVSGAVSQWRAKGSNRTFDQSIPANRPTTTTVNGRNAVKFDGLNDALASLSVDNPAERTLFAVAFRGNSATRQAVWASDLNSAGTWNSVGFNASGSPNFNSRHGNNQSAFRQAVSITTSVTAPTLFRFQYIQANITNENYTGVTGNANGVASSPAGGQDIENYRVGVFLGYTDLLNASGVQAFWLGGSICEVIAYNRILSSAEILTVENYLRRKWGFYPFAPPNYADADVNAYINAVELADQNHLETGVRDAINAFITGCKSDGIWSAIKASCILMGARTLSGALTPLVGSAPTNNGPFVGGDYNRKTGLAGNGTTKFLDSNRNNNSDPQNDFHMSSWHTTSGRMTMGFGGFGISGTSLFFPDGCMQCRSDTCGFFLGAGAGFTGASRASSAGFTGGRSGFSTNSVASSAPTAGPLLVLARHDSSSAANFSSERCSFYSFGTSLSLTSLLNRVSALNTAIGAAIP